MNCRCKYCALLGVNDPSNIDQAPTRCREEIENHDEIHQRQIKFITGDFSTEGNGSPTDKATKPKVASAPSKALFNRKTGKDKVIQNRRVNTDEWKSIKAHIRSIQSKHGAQAIPFAKCKLCGHKVRRYRYGYPDTQRILHHIAKHLPHRMFSCRQCEFKTKTLVRIYEHLKDRHHINKQVRDHFEEKTDQYSMEIKRMITTCFDTKKWTKLSAPSSNQGTGEKAKAGKKRGRLTMGRTDPLAMIRQAHCRDLSRKPKADETIECRKCLQTICVNPKDRRFAIRNHVEHKHLQKPTYKCLLCEDCSISYEALKGHFKSRHRGVTMVGNYESKENDFHVEIMAELSACFGPDSGEGERKAQSPLKVVPLAPSTSNKNRGKGASGRIAQVAKKTSEPKPRKDASDFDEPSTSDQHSSIRVCGEGPIDRHRCQYCGNVFKYEMILTKHMAFFHRGK